jgi:DNA ligase 1
MSATLKISRPILAKPYDFSQNPSGWMLSEKLDGIRALWDGEKFTSRNGLSIVAPEWFIADLPKTALDGELWIGRGRFQAVISEVNSGRFERVKFMVFDAPEVCGEFRARHLAACVAIAACAFARPALQMVCQSRKHFRESFHALVAAGGEGVVIRDPSSKYVSGNSSSFLKLKKTEDDEGELVSQNGKSLTLKWNGEKIKVPMTSELRASPPAIGSRITFQFNGLTDSGVPRHASFIAIRNYE